MKKAILLIIDGLGDLPTPKTPLQAAKKPNFDKLAKGGASGLLAPVGRYIVPGSDVAHLSILGYDPHKYYNGRGPLEALGLGIELKDGDVAFRANFATIERDEITDRRAGRIDTQTASKLASELSTKLSNGVEAIFKNSNEHRGVLVLRGSGLSEQVSATDPHGDMKLHPCQPLSEAAVKTAKAVDEFTQYAHRTLEMAPENSEREKPANVVLVRGAGKYWKVPSFLERFGLHGACVAGGALYKGVARYIGMDVVDVPGATGDKKTNLNAKGKAVLSALIDHDFVFLHVKGCDSAGHDGDFDTKKKMLERVDKELLPWLIKSGAYIIITGDHSTPCSRKAHSGHEVPILVYGDSERIDSVKKFDEISAASGGLGHLEGKDIVPLILNLIEKSDKYGS